MPPTKLTKRRLDALTPHDRERVFTWDDDLKGFGVCVFPSGRKVFVLQYRPAGQRTARRITLGNHGALTVDEARRLAKEHLGLIARGGDPGTARRRSREAPTMRELGEAYLEDVRARKKETTAAEYGRLWAKHVLPALGARKVADVTAADVARLHRLMKSTPYLANRMLAMLGAFFTFAAREGVRARHENPAHDVDFYPERARERFLTPAEFARVGEALARAEREGVPAAPEKRRRPKSRATAKHRTKSWDAPIPANPVAVAAIRLLILTGCRRGEILALRWQDVDLERGYLRLTDTKTGRSVRPLGAAAADILASLPRDDGSPFVFPGSKPGTHLTGITRLWFAIRHHAGLHDVRLHDLRHSFASVPAMGGDSLLVIRALLGHADAKTTQRYAHLGDDPVKAAADRTAGAIAAWLRGAETEVAPIERARGR